MSNPYETLGVNENASQEEIKRAYRELAKKYHPDQYGDNPLKDLAGQKMREINEAYDYLMKNSGASFNNQSSSASGNSNPAFQTIRQYISNGNLNQAEHELDSMNDKSAEWYFLKGFIYLKKGWYDNAYKFISEACRLDPNNFEYRNTLNSLNHNNTQFRGGYNTRKGGNDDFCNLCVNLWCLDSICECFGGDLIPCC